MKLPTTVFRNWGAGVVNSLRAEELPEQASPRGHNSALVSMAGNRALVGTRLGAQMVNLAPVVRTDNAELAQIQSLVLYNFFSGGTFAAHYLLSTDEGEIKEWEPGDGSHAAIPGTHFSPGQDPPLWAQLNNVLYGADGDSALKVVDVTGVATGFPVGMDAPTVALNTAGVGTNGDFYPEAIAGGAMSASTWQVALTWFNNNTGHESSLSPYVEVPVALNQRIQVTWDETPTDTQITHVRVYMRKVGVMTTFARLSAWEFAINDSPQLFGTAADLNASLLLTLAPSTTSNNPPVDNVLGFASHASRLFTWDAANIYWSQLASAEAFDPLDFLPVSPNDGSKIVAVHEVDNNTLVIFKERSMYGLYGTDPNSWTLELIDPSVGCVSPYSLVTIEGRTYWWSLLGPMAWDYGSAPQQVGYAYIQETVRPAALNPSYANRVVGVADPPNQRVQFAFPVAESLDRNTTMIPWSYRMNVWESDSWNPFDVASAMTATDEDGRQFVWLGGYEGRIFKWWLGNTDGLRSQLDFTIGTIFSSTEVLGTTEVVLDVDAGHEYLEGQHAMLYGFPNVGLDVNPLEGLLVEITDVQPTTITVTYESTGLTIGTGDRTIFVLFPETGQVLSATDNTLSVGLTTNLDVATLVGLYVYVFPADGTSYQRQRIESVDLATHTLTLVGQWVLVPDATYSWTLSGPMFEWDTKWHDDGEAFMSKRYMFAYADMICATGSTTAHVDVFLNSTQTTVHRTFSLSVHGAGAAFDFAQFDEDVFGAEGVSRMRRRVAKIGHNIRLRVRHYENNRQIILLKLGISAHALTDRRS